MGSSASAPAPVRLTDRSTVIFAGKARARQLLSRSDSFSQSLSPFDRSVRMRSESPVSEEAFLEFAGASALDWEPAEAEFLTACLSDISPGLAPYAHLLPPEILLIKTTGAEEFKSAYTRQNAVILPPNKLDRPRDRLASLLAHELFHLVSRYHPALREALYSAIGFRPCGKVGLPEGLRDRTLKNPDTPDTDYYVCLTHGGKPFNCVPLFSFRDGQCDIRHGEAILQYLEVNYLAVRKAKSGWEPLELGGLPVLIDQREASGLAEQAGRNTVYTICAEEILADNFALLVTGKGDAPSPEVLDRLRIGLCGTRVKE